MKQENYLFKLSDSIYTFFFCLCLKGRTQCTKVIDTLGEILTTYTANNSLKHKTFLLQ
jgi:hypothetical protein